MSLKSRLRRLRVVLWDRRWWPFYLQRRVLSAKRREFWADRFSAKRPQWSGPSEPNAIELAERLGGSGMAQLGKVLSEQQCRDVLEYLKRCSVSDPYRPETKQFFPASDQRPANSHVAYHLPADVVKAPHLLALANSPLILSAVAKFLGCKPTLDYLAAWWSYPTDVAPQQAENFHRDVDDWRFVKLFVYLTDVGPDQGPHVYVTHSAMHPAHRRPKRLTDDEVRVVRSALRTSLK